MRDANQIGLAGLGYNDPFVPEIGMTNEFPEFAGRKSVGITDDHDVVFDDYRSVDFAKFKCHIVGTRIRFE